MADINKVAAYAVTCEKVEEHLSAEDMNWAIEKTYKSIQKRKENPDRYPEVADIPKFYLFGNEIGELIFMFATHELEKNEVRQVWKNVRVYDN